MDDNSNTEHFDVENSFITNEQDGSIEHHSTLFNQQILNTDVEKHTIEENQEILERSEGQVDGVLACQTDQTINSCGEIGDDCSANFGINEVSSTTLIESHFVEEHAEQIVSEQLNLEPFSPLNSSEGIRTDIDRDEKEVPHFDQRPQDVHDKPVRWQEEPTEQVIQSTGQETNVVKLYNEKNDIIVRDLSTLEKDQMSTLGEASSERLDHEELTCTQDKSEVDTSKENEGFTVQDISSHSEVHVESGTIESISSTTEVIENEIEITQNNMDISTFSGREVDITVESEAISANMESNQEESSAQNGEVSELLLNNETGKDSNLDESDVVTVTEDNSDCRETAIETTELQTIESTTSTMIAISGVSESVTIVESTETVEERTSSDEAQVEDVTQKLDQVLVDEINKMDTDTTEECLENEIAEPEAKEIGDTDSLSSSSSSSSSSSDEDESKKENDNVIVAVPITITTPSEDSEIDSENATPCVESEGENDDTKDIVSTTVTTILSESTVTDEAEAALDNDGEKTIVVQKNEEGVSTVTTESVSSHVDESGVETIVTETVITTIVGDSKDDETNTEAKEEGEEGSGDAEGGSSTVVTKTETVEDDGTTVVTTTEIVEVDGATIVTKTETVESDDNKVETTTEDVEADASTVETTTAAADEGKVETTTEVETVDESTVVTTKKTVEADESTTVTTTETVEADGTTVVTTTETVETDGTTVVTTTEIVETDGGIIDEIGDKVVTSEETVEVTDGSDKVVELVPEVITVTEESEQQSVPEEVAPKEDSRTETATVEEITEAIEKIPTDATDGAKETSSSSSSSSDDDDEKEKEKTSEIVLIADEPKPVEIAVETVEAAEEKEEQKEEEKAAEVTSKTVTEVITGESATTIETVTTTSETVESEKGETVTVVETVTTIVKGEAKAEDDEEKEEEKLDGEGAEGAAVLQVDNPEEITVAQAKEEETKPLIEVEASPAKVEKSVKPGENGKQALDDSDKETTTLLKKEGGEKPLKDEEDCSCCTVM